MKKIIALLLIIVTLSSCSIQEKMNVELFAERFMIDCNNDFVIDEIYYHNESAKIYLNDLKDKDYLIEAYCDSLGNICKITLTGDGLLEDFCNFANKIINIYSPDIISESVLENLFSNSFDYNETQWYYITSAKKENMFFFSIENKKLSSPKNTERTLKNNDITITKGSE